MGSASATKNKLYIQVILIIEIMITLMLLNWFCDKVLFQKGYPVLLSISDVVDISDLLIGVFTAQVAMVTIAIAFSGLLMQLFNANENYLGMSLREVIVSRPIYGFSLLCLLGTSLFSSIWSYYLAAQSQIGAVVSLFAVNIVIVFILFRYYMRNAIFNDDTKQYIRDQVEQEFIQAVDEENNGIKDILK